MCQGLAVAQNSELHYAESSACSDDALMDLSRTKEQELLGSKTGLLMQDDINVSWEVERCELLMPRQENQSETPTAET